MDEMRRHLEALEGVRGFMAVMLHTGTARHVAFGDLEALDRVIEALAVEAEIRARISEEEE